MTEAELQEQVRLMCQQLGLYHYHPHDSRRSERGWPDSTIVRPGRIAFRELKTASGHLTGPQKEFGYLVKSHPGPWVVDWACWRPADLIGGHVGQFLGSIR